MSAEVDQLRRVIERFVGHMGLPCVQIAEHAESDSIYLEVRKPREISAELGVLESWSVRVRISTQPKNWADIKDLMTADFSVDLWQRKGLCHALEDLSIFFGDHETHYVD